jgi:hypothetical protein
MANMITISNLTPKQKLLLDVMWELDSLDKVKAFIATLPVQDARDAHGLLQIAIWETIEQEDGLDAYKDNALAAIASARGN